MRFLALFAAFVTLTPSCKTTTRDSTSEIKTALTYSPIETAELKGLNFEFCADKRAFNAPNALWLDYFASILYANYDVVGSELEGLPFGSPGEAGEIRKNALILRFKRVHDGQKSAEDDWDSEAERDKVREKLRREYLSRFGTDLPEDARTAEVFEQDVMEAKAGKIVFLNSSKQKGFLGRPSTQALYAESRTQDYAILSFRGTEFDETADLIADASLLQKDFLEMGRVHRGFLFSLREISDSLYALLSEKSKDKPLKIWVTGHSLGAAIGTLFVAEFLKRQDAGEFPKVSLAGGYVYGSPRVGNKDFAQSFHELLGRHQSSFVRIRNRRDPVTMIPVGMPGIGSYQHVGAFAYIDGKGTMHLAEGDSLNATDFNRSALPNLNDHLLMGYWRGVKGYYESSLGRSDANCGKESDDAPPEFFWE